MPEPPPMPTAQAEHCQPRGGLIDITRQRIAAQCTKHLSVNNVRRDMVLVSLEPGSHGRRSRTPDEHLVEA